MPGTERIPAFVAVRHRASTPAPRRQALLRAIGEHCPALRRQKAVAGLELLIRPSAPALKTATNRSGSVLVVGQIFERGPGGSAPSRPADIGEMEGDVDMVARALVDDHWGSYIAFLRCPATGNLFVLRDPSGAIPVAILDDAELAIVADQIPRWLHEAVAGPPTIDWNLVAAQLLDPSVASRGSFLSAVRPVAAGSLAAIDAGQTRRQVWDPLKVAARAVPDVDRLAQHLAFTVRDSVAALTASHDRLLLELSGGLDSAILLGCIASRHAGGPPPCINSATMQASGDERVYARAAADRHGAMLTEIVVAPAEMDYARLADQSDISEPLLYGADTSHERIVTGLADALDASAIVTGQGGDAVFFQEPTPLVAVDQVRAYGLNRATWPTVLDSAHRSQGSIWSVLAAARASRRHQMLTLIEHDNMLLGPAARATSTAPCHPWLTSIEALPPAKRIQLQLLSVGQFFRGPTTRAERFDLIHPLLAQPVVELCLAIPTWQLSYGRLDRALARQAFAADLPEIIARRRGKGEVSTYYSHAIIANLPFLRGLLLDGLLVQHGLLGNDRLDAALSERSMVQRPDHRVIIAYASLEGWLRSWS